MLSAPRYAACSLSPVNNNYLQKYHIYTNKCVMKPLLEARPWHSSGGRHLASDSLALQRVMRYPAPFTKKVLGAKTNTHTHISVISLRFMHPVFISRRCP